MLNDLSCGGRKSSIVWIWNSPPLLAHLKMAFWAANFDGLSLLQIDWYNSIYTLDVIFGRVNDVIFYT